MKRTLWLVVSLLVCSPAIAEETADPFDGPSIGATYFDIADASEEDRKTKRLPTSGVYLSSVVPYSSLAASGVKTNDIVFAVNDKPIKTVVELEKALGGVKVADKVRLKVHRGDGKKPWQQISATMTILKRRDAVKAAVNEERDEVKGITFIRHKDAPESVNVKSNLQIYLSVPDAGAPTMFLRLNNYNRASFFASSFTIRSGASVFEIDPAGRVHRDFSSGGCWTWYDHAIESESDTKMVASIAINEKGILRFEGTDEVRDHDIDANERAMLTTMLDRYRLLAAERK